MKKIRLFAFLGLLAAAVGGACRPRRRNSPWRRCWIIPSSANSPPMRRAAISLSCATCAACAMSGSRMRQIMRRARSRITAAMTARKSPSSLSRPTARRCVYVRGGDHDANWAAAGDLAPDPDSALEQPKVTIWLASLDGGAPVKIAEGDAPKLSARGQLAYIAEHAVWTVALDGKGKPVKAVLRSRQGQRSAMVAGRKRAGLRLGSRRSCADRRLSPEGQISVLARAIDRQGVVSALVAGRQAIAFVRRPGDGGPPKPLLVQTPDPWSIWVADAATGDGHAGLAEPGDIAGLLSRAPKATPICIGRRATASSSSPISTIGRIFIRCPPMAAASRMLLTPGNFMVENVVESRDGRFLIYSANTGATKDDGERRHIFRVPVDAPPPVAVTSGEGLEVKPVLADDAHVAFICAGCENAARHRVCRRRWQGAARTCDRRPAGGFSARRADGAQGGDASRPPTASPFTAICSTMATARRPSPPSFSSMAARRGRCCWAGITWTITPTAMP